MDRALDILVVVHIPAGEGIALDSRHNAEGIALGTALHEQYTDLEKS